MLKRIFLFVLTNIAVMVVISIILKVLNVQPYLTKSGLNYQALLVFAMVVGFTGAFVSLFLSKFMAKMMYGVKLIQTPTNHTETYLMQTIATLAQRMNIGMPDVGIYESPEVNAFATGWNKNKALVAVSTGLLQQMDQDEIEGVLGHEMAHVANGDMVTLALIQGIVNTFVIFFARIAAYFVTQFFSRDEEEGEGVGGLTYMLVSLVFEIFFGILASVIVMWFSRLREFRADAGSAQYVGKDKMIKALQRLQSLHELPLDPRGKEFATMKISGGSPMMQWFASHPPLEARIAALKA